MIRLPVIIIVSFLFGVFVYPEIEYYVKYYGFEETVVKIFLSMFVAAMLYILWPINTSRR